MKRITSWKNDCVRINGHKLADLTLPDSEVPIRYRLQPETGMGTAESLAMAEYFAGGHLRFVNGEWRDDNGDDIEISRVRHGHWISLTECANEGVYCSICKKKVWKSDYAWCSKRSRNKLRSNYCPNCGAAMDLEE